MEMSPFLYLAFFKTILPALFRTFGLPSRFWPSKPSFLHDHFTTQHSDFSIFLSVPITDKPVNRSIHAYALTWLNVFVLRGLSFLIFTKKMEGVRAIRAIKYKKKGWKVSSCIRTFGAKEHKSNIRVKRWRYKYANSELD